MPSASIMRPSVPDVHISDSRDSDYAVYRPLAAQSVAGFVFGLLSPSALITPMFWVVPAVGVFFSSWALRRIRRDAAALTGRKLAWVGLFLSLAVRGRGAHRLAGLSPGRSATRLGSSRRCGFSILRTASRKKPIS